MRCCRGECLSEVEEFLQKQQQQKKKKKKKKNQR
jgi:hypothetical protein